MYGSSDEIAELRTELSQALAFIDRVAKGEASQQEAQEWVAQKEKEKERKKKAELELLKRLKEEDAQEQLFPVV